MIQVKDLNYTYHKGSEPAVRGLEFTVADGEIFGFLGPSGAGDVSSISIGRIRIDRTIATVVGGCGGGAGRPHFYVTPGNLRRKQGPGFRIGEGFRCDPGAAGIGLVQPDALATGLWLGPHVLAGQVLLGVPVGRDSGMGLPTGWPGVAVAADWRTIASLRANRQIRVIAQ